MTDREAMLKSALRHLMYKDHELSPTACDACLDVAAWLTIPGYDGKWQSPLLRIAEEAI